MEEIKINNKEHKTSQYADDTSVLSLRTILKHVCTLEWLFQKSSLNLNYSKIKMIRIGLIRETDQRYCRKNNLDWVCEFTALRIEYDVKDIIKINDQKY